MIRPGGHGQRRWVILAGLALFLVLAYLFYEARMRPEPTDPKVAAPIEQR